MTEHRGGGGEAARRGARPGGNGRARPGRGRGAPPPPPLPPRGGGRAGGRWGPARPLAGGAAKWRPAAGASALHRRRAGPGGSGQAGAAPFLCGNTGWGSAAGGREVDLHLPALGEGPLRNANVLGHEGVRRTDRKPAACARRRLSTAAVVTK